MDATTTPPVRAIPTTALDARTAARITEHTLDALKTAIEEPGEHRLFRWGKLPGLFASRAGVPGAAATAAVDERLIEITRSEARGKLIVEWVKATPNAVRYVHDHDSPKAVLRELVSVLGATQSAIPDWMEQAREEASQLTLRFEHRAQDMLDRLEKLSERVESALRRAEAAKPSLGSGMTELVRWGVAALEYLDRRAESLTGDCPLPDLFRAMEVRCPDLTMSEFQNGLKRLHDARAVRLLPGAIPSEPEYSFVMDNEMMWLVRR